LTNCVPQTPIPQEAFAVFSARSAWPPTAWPSFKAAPATPDSYFGRSRSFAGELTGVGAERGAAILANWNSE
jgi:hypothetical protein